MIPHIQDGGYRLLSQTQPPWELKLSQAAAKEGLVFLVRVEKQGVNIEALGPFLGRRKADRVVQCQAGPRGHPGLAAKLQGSVVVHERDRQQLHGPLVQVRELQLDGSPVLGQIGRGASGG